MEAKSGLLRHQTDYRFSSYEAFEAPLPNNGLLSPSGLAARLSAIRSSIRSTKSLLRSGSPPPLSLTLENAFGTGFGPSVARVAFNAGSPPASVEP